MCNLHIRKISSLFFLVILNTKFNDVDCMGNDPFRSRPTYEPPNHNMGYNSQYAPVNSSPYGSPMYELDITSTPDQGQMYHSGQYSNAPSFSPGYNAYGSSASFSGMAGASRSGQHSLDQNPHALPAMGTNRNPSPVMLPDSLDDIYGNVQTQGADRPVFERLNRTTARKQLSSNVNPSSLIIPALQLLALYFVISFVSAWIKPILLLAAFCIVGYYHFPGGVIPPSPKRQ